MDPGTSSLKRKRENEYPRVTFNAGPRTFDRLLKEKTLDELKDGVRKKLGYPSQVPLHLAQLRAGKSVDLEDEDDFEAFCSAAYSSSVITVQVIEPEDFTRAMSTPVPPNENAPPGSPKKRKKKRKLADDSTVTQDETEPTHGLKRKALTLDSDPEASPSKEPEPAPPKKKKKRDVHPIPPNESATTEDVVAPKITNVDKSAGEKSAEKEKAAGKEKAAEKEEAVETGKGKATEKKKKEKAAKATTKKAGQSKSKKDKSIPEAEADAEPTGNAPRGEDAPEKPKKKKAAKDKASGDKSAPQGEGGEQPEPDAGAAGTTAKGDKGKETPKNKKAGRTGNEKDASDKAPAAPQPVADDEDDEDEDEEPDSGKGKKKTPAKAPIVTREKAAIAKKTAGGKPTTEAAQNQKESSTTGTGGAAEKPADPKASSKNPSDAAVCPTCARAPTHARSRCNIYRASLPANLSFLHKLKDKQAEDPTDEFRARQIQLVEDLITKKQVKLAQNGKVVSDIVVGVAANSSTKSAKSARVNQSKVSAPKAPTLVPSSKPPNENAAGAHTSKLSASAQGTSAHSTTEGTSSDEPLATKTKLPIPRPPDVQQSKKDLKPTTKGTGSAQKASTSKVPSSPPDEESPDETPTKPTKKPVPPPPARQKLTVLVESGSSPDESSDKTSVPKPQPGAKHNSSSSSPSSSDDNSDEETPSRLPPPPGSNVPANLSSLTDAELDAVIRGPRFSITSKNLPLSGSSSDEDDEKDSEDLVQDSEEEKGPRRRRSIAFKGAQLSSDEEDSDGGDQDSEKSEEDQTSHGRKPPRLSVDTKLQTDESSPSTAVEHGSLSFGAANDLASSVEIDSRGDRAFSEAFADDTAVFKLAAVEPEDSNGDDESDGSDHRLATPKKKTSTANNDRHDSIEPFESPEKPKSPIIQQDLLQTTPRGLAQRMKDRRGKTPVPASSVQKAFKLFDSAAKLANASARAATLKPTQSQKPGPVTSTPANPSRTTRSQAKGQSQASDITLNAEETPLGANNWEVLQAEESFAEETNMEDELHSDPLFIPGETQNSFPYSQRPQPAATSPNDSDDENEVENAIVTPRPATASQGAKFGYTGLSQIASQRRLFCTSLPTAPSRPTDKKDTVAELYGQAGEEPSDDSGSDSDSDSDAEKPAQKSHIPQSRRAGVRSKA